MTTTALVVALSLLAAAPKTTTPGSDVEIHGHRGARSVLPENSIPAFLHALDAGAHVLEMDTVVTADDQVVVLHDPILSRDLCGFMTGEVLKDKVAVRALTLKELRAYHCTRLLDRFPKQKPIERRPIPTLAEVLTAVAGHPRGGAVRFNIETKIDPRKPALAPAPDRFAQLFVDVLRRAKVLDRSVIQSFDPRTLVAAQKIAPSLTRSILLEAPPADVVATARAARAAIVSPYHRWLTPAHVRAIHDAGLQVIPWTANEPDQWQRLMVLGVDGIITDHPAALKKWLDARGRTP